RVLAIARAFCHPCLRRSQSWNHWIEQERRRALRAEKYPRQCPLPRVGGPPDGSTRRQRSGDSAIHSNEATARRRTHRHAIRSRRRCGLPAERRRQLLHRPGPRHRWRLERQRMKTAVGIDLGGTQIKSVVATEAGDIFRRELRPTDETESFADTVRALASELGPGL